MIDFWGPDGDICALFLTFIFGFLFGIMSVQA